MFYKDIKKFSQWKIPLFDHDSEIGYRNKVIVAFDAEYQSGVTKPINIGGKKVDILQRRTSDIISIQIAVNYENKDPIQYFIHRDANDPVFRFNDLIKPVIQYLKDIGVYKDLKKDVKTFTFEFWTFWGGVDLSVFEDWEKVLTEYVSSNEKSKTSKLVSIHGNTVFTSKPLKLIIKDKYRNKIQYFENMRLVVRDMTKLAPGKSNLEKLGDLVNVPKLDTELWDHEDGKFQGYYKSHMSELWKNRQEDFMNYALRDAVITALYGSFMLEFQENLIDHKLGSFKPVELKPSLGSIAANVVAKKNTDCAAWIVERVIKQMKKIGGDNGDITSFLKGICLVQYKTDSSTKNQFLDFGFEELFAGKHDLTSLKRWLKGHLDFSLIRKGYKFPRSDVSKSSLHKYRVNDITNKIDAPLNTFFNDAVSAYSGGYNVTHVTGIVPDQGFKQDYDLKSAYNTAGHLIPDIAPGLGFQGHVVRNLAADKFVDLVNETKKMNGPYTVGVGVFDVTYPNDYKGFVITPKSINDGPRYFRRQEAVTLSYTDAYTAWVCGAKVFTHRISFPYQAKMTTGKMLNICKEGTVQDVFQKRRSMYPDRKDPLNVMNKNVGNQVYGVTGEGLKEKHSRDFNNGKGYYIPFSQITNPLKAMQYTAITRLHIILLQRAILSTEPEAIFLNNVTDGCLVWTVNKLDSNKIMKAMNTHVDFRYREVVMNNFNGDYFEEKDGTRDKVANLRTRLSFSADGKLKALVGVNQSLITPADVFRKYLNTCSISLPVENHVITGITDMRHTKKFQHLQSSWQEPVDLVLGYDFSQWPFNFQRNGQSVYWITRPYVDENEFQYLQWFGRTLVKYGPWYSSEYASFFKRTLDEYSNGLKPKYFGEFLEKDNIKNPKVGNEVYVNWVRYVLRNGLELRPSYQTISDLISGYGFSYFKGGDEVDIPSYGAFKTYVSRNSNRKKELINYVLLHRLGLI